MAIVNAEHTPPFHVLRDGPFDMPAAVPTAPACIRSATESPTVALRTKPRIPPKAPRGDFLRLLAALRIQLNRLPSIASARLRISQAGLFIAR